MTITELEHKTNAAIEQLKNGEQLPEEDFSDIAPWDDIIYTTVNRMIAFRLKNKITQEQIAERMGVKQSMISRFENMGRIPSVELMYKYADALGLELYISPFGDRTITFTPAQVEIVGKYICPELPDIASVIDKMINSYIHTDVENISIDDEEDDNEGEYLFEIPDGQEEEIQYDLAASH